MKLSDFTLPVKCIKTQEVCTINMSEIDKYEKNGKKLVVSTPDSKFELQFYDLETLEEMFFHLGLWLTDRTNVVNLNRVIKYDVELGNLYFKNTNTIGSVAKVNQRVVEEELKNIGQAQIMYKQSSSKSNLQLRLS